MHASFGQLALYMFCYKVDRYDILQTSRNDLVRSFLFFLKVYSLIVMFSCQRDPYHVSVFDGRSNMLVKCRLYKTLILLKDTLQIAPSFCNVALN